MKDRTAPHPAGKARGVLVLVPFALVAVALGAAAGNVFGQASVTCGQGATLRVDPTDPSAYATISAALSAAAPGDRISVAAATYPEAPTVGVDAIQLVGDSLAATITGTGPYNLKVAADGVCIDNLTLAGGAEHPLSASQVSELSVHDVVLADARGAGLLIEDASHVDLHGLATPNASVNGIVLRRVNDATIQDSTIQSAGRGIHLDQVAGAVLRGNHVEPGDEDGIVLEDSPGPSLLQGNDVRGGVYGIWVLRSEAVDGADDVVSDHHDLGWRIESSHDVTIHGGSVTGGHPGSNDGVHVRDSASITVAGLHLTDLLVNGIYAKGSQDLVVASNVIRNVTRGIHLLESHGTDTHDNVVQEAHENGIVLEDVTGPSRLVHNAVQGATWGAWILRSDDVTMSDSTLDGTRDRGLRIEGSRGSQVSNVTVGGSGGDPTNLALDVINAQGARIESSEFTNARVTGVHIGGGSGITFTHNRVHDVGRAVHLTDASNVLVQQNDIRDLSDNGIVVEPGQGIQILDNQLANGAIGIWFIRSQGDGNLVRGNQVTGFNSSGISLDAGTQGVTVESNVVTQSHRGLKVLHGSTTAPTAPNYFGNNTITGNDYGVWSDDTFGLNTFFGGRITQNTLCDFWLLNQTQVRVEHVDFGAGSTANNDSKMILVQNQGPLTSCVPPPAGTRTITAGVGAHACNPSRWQFVINQVRAAQAPATVHVRWSNGEVQDVPLQGVTGSTAHYVTTRNLDSVVTSATANIYQGWSGQFQLSDGPC